MSTAVAHSPFSSLPKTLKASVPNPNPNFRFCKTLLSSSIPPNLLDLSSIHGGSASYLASPLWSSSRPFYCTSVPSLLCNRRTKGFKIGATSVGETSGEEVDTLLDTVKWDSKGLAVAIAQNVDTGAILMQGFANREALATTILTQKATFYSRSRLSLWTKGETSMNFINVHDIFLDCDRDSIIYLGKPDGPTCHTGMETCYYSSVNGLLKQSKVEQSKLAMTTLYSLESTIAQRKAEIGETENGKPSWTKRILLDKELLCSKIREEAEELCRTLEENEDKSCAASEMADVLYHCMALLAVKDVKVEDVLQVLRHRFSQSGIEEKNSRKARS